MSASTIKAGLREIYEERIDLPGGVTWDELVEEFNRRHPKARTETGADLFDAHLRRSANDIIRDADRQTRTQLTLPGVSEWDATVTIPEGTDLFRRKRLEHATTEDLERDFKLHDQNVSSAQEALERAENRNDTLLPVMAEHGFRTAGKAIEWLISHANPDGGSE